MSQAIAIPHSSPRDSPDSNAGTDPASASMSGGPVRLFKRRGSRSAPDPWATSSSHLQPTGSEASSPGNNMVSTSSSVSRITIVRVPDGAVATEEPDFGTGAQSSSGRSGRPGRSNSWGSNHSASSSNGGSIGRPASPGASRRAAGGRMSFAFSSFTPINPAPEPSPTSSGPSPSHSGGATPTTPSSPATRYRRSFSNPSLAPLRPNLTPQQIYDLAMDSMAPSAPSSPSASYTPNAYFNSNSRPSSLSRPTTPGVTERTAPAVFTPLPEEVYLPFVNRPVEVTQLLTETSTSKLYHLLEALFPPEMRHGRSKEKSAAEEVPDTEEDSPKQWTFDRLSHHLMEVTRAEINDKIWVDLARTCIRSRSEALWERFKGALGVPAELDGEMEWDEEQVAEEENAAATSALDDGFENFTTSTSRPASIASRSAVEFARPESITSDSHVGELHLDLPDSTLVDPEADGRTAYLEPVFVDEESEAAAPVFSSGVSDGGWSSNRHMENIGEGEEEEKEDIPEPAPAPPAIERRTRFDTSATTYRDESMETMTQAEFDAFGTGMSSPSREIRALQITTSPSNPTAHTPLPAFSTTPATPPIPSPNAQPASLSATPDITSDSSGSRSASPLAARLLNRRPSHAISHGSGKERISSSLQSEYKGFGGYGLAPTDTPYHPALSERGPGNPLFPSSFADLSISPTLAANIPKQTRSASMSQTSHYPPSLAHSFKQRSSSPNNVRRMTSMAAANRRALVGNWADVKDRYEYAVTVASASSDGGRG